MFTAKQISDVISYSPETGNLTWKVRPESYFSQGVRTPAQKAKIFNSHFAEKPAFASKTSHGYFAGTFKGKAIKAHQAAWAIYYGEWPNHVIDHINGDGTDNRIENLRAATFAQNSQNSSKYNIPKATSKFKGVSRMGKKWKATVNASNARTYLGLFDDEVTAAVAYDLAASVLHGEFCNLNLVTDKDAMAAFATEYARKHHADIPNEIVNTYTVKEPF